MVSFSINTRKSAVILAEEKRIANHAIASEEYATIERKLSSIKFINQM